ncbi:Activator of stress protein 1 [Escovopsis weberi]|uniref:Activator of stress protein 1 n=1 Tax=Escovopsis weberi TaxID=150374 RepID=A0A0M8MQ35_ESCWE|nr:Activator of stress protein 1 [Escovopsis weberi]
MTKIGSLTKTQSSTLTAALEDVATNACLANFTLPGNFPFGTPGATKYYARDAVTRLLASERPNVERYTQAYVELLDVVNPILDVQIFRQEVDRYWQESHAANLCWLSQFLMVIGLGCFVACDESPVATELMMAAEACLMQTPFSFRPTLLSLKTMALMVVAKQVCNATCWSVDSCWSFLGLLVRTAFIYGLPQDTSQGGDPTQTPEENDARKKLWLTILYLDIKVAMCTGMPPLTRPDELDGLKKIPEWGAADSLQRVLYQSLPTVLTIMSHINSRKEQIAYPDVLRYNGQIRELMAHAQRVCPDPLQRMTLDIFLRRCLMVLHRPFALHQEGPVMFPESYWSSLECCITLLMSYRDMWSGESSKRLDLLGRAYVLDFFSGSLTTYIHILREDAPLAGPESMGCVIPPKQLILELLKDCVEIWSPEKDRSVCYRTGYNLLEAVLNLLPKNTSPAK